MALKISCLNPRFPRILLGKADFVFLMKAKITQRRLFFHKLCLVYVREGTRRSLQYLFG